MNARFPRPAETGPPLALPRRSIPSIAGLIAFEATARHLSFSQAARDLALSQGAVSKRVRALEDTLGVALLHRNRHEVRLTDTGRRFLTEVRRILAEFEAATRAYRAPATAGAVLSIGLPQAVAACWLLPRLPRFEARHPGIRVNLTPLPVADRTAPAPDGTIEPGPAPVAEGSVPLWEEALVPVASPALAARARAEGAGALMRLHLAPEPDLWDRWHARHGGPEGRDGPTHAGLSLVIEAAILGHGAALVAEALAEGAIAAGRLVPLSPERLSTGRVMRFVPAAGRRAAPAVGRFAAWLADEAGTPPQRDAAR